MRYAEWKIVKDSSSPGKPYRLSIPASVSDTGKRQNQRFRTREAAELYIEELQIRRETFGDLAQQISAGELAEAVECLKLLRPRHLRLLDSVRAYLGDLDRRSQSKTLSEVFDFVVGLKKRSPSYVEELRQTRASIIPLLNTSIAEISAADIEKCFEDSAPHTRNARIRRLRTVLKKAFDKGWIQTNVAKQLDLTHFERKEVQIYHVDQVERLLRYALEEDKSLVPYMAISCFCGLRPENEGFNLEWSDVHLDDPKPQIVVRAHLNKTRGRRFVDISGNCIEWIRASGAKLQGRVCPFSASTLRRKLRTARNKTGTKVIQDGFRHTFCSAYLTYHQSVDRLLMQTGHSDPQVLWTHYYRVMHAEEAGKYWNLTP